MWEKLVQRGRPEMAIWRMSILCWIPKATNKNSPTYNIITFLLQKCLHAPSSTLRYTYIASFVLLIEDTRVVQFLT
jgi:hypothetical protein